MPVQIAKVQRLDEEEKQEKEKREKQEQHQDSQKVVYVFMICICLQPVYRHEGKEQSRGTEKKKMEGQKNKKASETLRVQGCVGPADLT